MTKRIAAAILLTVWATLAAAGVIAYFTARAQLLADLDRELVARASLVPEVAGGADLPKQLRLRPGDRYLVREVPRRTMQMEASDVPPPREPEVLHRGFAALGGGRRVRNLTLEFPANLFGPGRPPATRTVVFSAPADRLDAVLRRLALGLSAFGVIGGAAAVAVALAAARSALKPLRATADTLGSISERQLDRRIDAYALPPELRPMAKRLNDMLAKLERAFAQRRRFLADAAHELRTPVAALITTLEIALRRPREQEELLEVLRICLSDARLLRRLVGSLLEQARSENPAMYHLIETVDLVALLGECAAVGEGLAAERDVRVVFDPGANMTTDTAGGTAMPRPAATLPIRTQPERLRSVVMNLMSNAIEHNRAGGTVELGLRAGSGGDVEVAVRDTGSGIAPEHLPNLFQPFYRVESARPTETHPLGLGLFLVKTHVDALGGECRVESEVGVGSVFTIRLPAVALQPAPGEPAAGIGPAPPPAGGGANGELAWAGAGSATAAVAEAGEP